MTIRQSFLLIAPALLLSCFSTSGPAQVSATAAKSDPLHAWIGAKSPADITAWISQRLAAEQKDVAALTALLKMHGAVKGNETNAKE